MPDPGPPGAAGADRSLPADPAAEEITSRLAEVAGDGLRAVLLFGSRLVGAAPGRFSAYDLVVVVAAYRSFYRRLREEGHHRRPAWLLTGLAHVLPPNVVAFDPGLPGGELAKAMILTREHFHRALSPGARDHFLRGRLVQRVGILHADSPSLAAEIDELLEGARRDAIRWTAPWLPDTFTAEELVRRMLQVSYAAEIRPEAGRRVQDVLRVQEEHLVRVFRGVLGRAADEGLVAAHGKAWRLVRPPGLAGRLRWRLYFALSKARATARWFKHVVTFDDWLTYIRRKVERRTGMRIEITPRERRFPLLLLWPKVFRVLRHVRRSRDGGPDDPDASGGPEPAAVEGENET